MFSKQKFSLFFLSLFISIYLISCVSSSPITYRYDKDKSAPIQEYSTYKIIKPTEEVLAQMETRHTEYLATIIEQMEKRNYSQTDDIELLVTYFVTGKNFQKAQSNTVSVGVGFGGPFGGVGMSQGKTNVNFEKVL